MKHAVNDVVRIVNARSRNLPTMLQVYVGSEAVVLNVDAEHGLYRIAIDVGPGREPPLFNVTDSMVEPDVTAPMLEAGTKFLPDVVAWKDDPQAWWKNKERIVSEIYRAMRAARYKRLSGKIEEYVRKAAAANGVDPDVAVKLAGIESK